MKLLAQWLVYLSLSLSVACSAVASEQRPTIAMAEGNAAKPTSTPLSQPTITPTPAVLATETPSPTPTHTPPPNPSATRHSTPGLLPSPAPSLEPTLTPTAAPVSTLNPADQVARGFEVYKQQYCGLCHQLDAAGTAGQFGPTHNGIGIIAEKRIIETGYTGSATSAAEYLHESIVDPKIYMLAGYEHTPHQMPAYVHLSESDVEALVQMLLQQK